MAYNGGYYPQYYQPVQGNGYPMQMNVGGAQPNVGNVVNNTTAQIQNGGFISVPSEDIVKTYPVAPGNCVTFKIEGKPVVMEKSMGFSQFESPNVKRYRLVEEKEEEETHRKPHKSDLDIKPIYDRLDALEEKIGELEEEMEGVKNVPVAPTKKTVSKKKEVIEDDSE